MTTNAKTAHKGRKVSLLLRGVNKPEVVQIEGVFTLNAIPDVKESIVHPDTNLNHAHLVDLTFPLVDTPIEILLGADVISKFPITESRIGKSDSPSALHLVIGWALAGPDSNLSQLNTSRQSFHRMDAEEADPQDQPLPIGSELCHVCTHDFTGFQLDPCDSMVELSLTDHEGNTLRHLQTKLEFFRLWTVACRIFSELFFVSHQVKKGILLDPSFCFIHKMASWKI